MMHVFKQIIRTILPICFVVIFSFNRNVARRYVIIFLKYTFLNSFKENTVYYQKVSKHLFKQ